MNRQEERQRLLGLSRETQRSAERLIRKNPNLGQPLRRLKERQERIRKSARHTKFTRPVGHSKILEAKLCRKSRARKIKTWYCKPCKQKLNSHQQYKEHLESKKHKSAVEKKHCELCGMRCNGAKQHKNHIESVGHIRKKIWQETDLHKIR